MSFAQIAERTRFGGRVKIDHQNGEHKCKEELNDFDLSTQSSEMN